jgi:hypothetical protein
MPSANLSTSQRLLITLLDSAVIVYDANYTSLE